MSAGKEYRDTVEDLVDKSSSSEEEDDDDDDDDEDDEEDDEDLDDPGTLAAAAASVGSRVKRAATVTDGGSPIHRQSSADTKKKWCWPPPSSSGRSSSLPTSPRLPPWAPLLRSQNMASSQASPAASPAPDTSGAIAAIGAMPADHHAKVFGHRLKLYCRSGYHLSIKPNGEVSGSDDPNDRYAVLELSSVKTGEIRIRGVASNRYLAMNRKGRIHGQIHKKENTVFVESLLGSYNTYLSRKYAHLGWYVAIRKNGRRKPAQKTRWGQKAIQFLPVRV